MASKMRGKGTADELPMYLPKIPTERSKKSAIFSVGQLLGLDGKGKNGWGANVVWLEGL